MKIVKVCYMAGFAMAAVSPTRGDYPTLERARELFAPEVIANTNANLRTDEYISFINDLWNPHHTETESLQMMNYLLSSLTSVVARVSTNAVDDGVYVHQMYVNTMWYDLFQTFDAFTMNDAACLTLAKYIGQLQVVSFPSNLAQMRRSVSFVTTNAQKRAAWQERERKWREKQRLQSRVFSANEEIREYRSWLFLICNMSVLGCRKVMGDTEFAAFTNRVVELSNPDEREKRRLFNHLDEVKRK